MAEPSKKSIKERIGCAVVVVAVLIVAVGGGLWLGHRDDEAKTPCERYARTVARALDNCHSGQNRTYSHHVEICEKSLQPDDACLEQIRKLSQTSCETLEREVFDGFAGCRKQP
jgi:hypothetical protein